MNIYLDNAATTRPYPEVIEVMRQCQEENFGNASSINNPGVKAATAIEKARLIIARAIHATPEEIFFTSGGSEANNLSIFGIANGCKKDQNHIITSAIEHPSIYEAVRWLGTQGFQITYLPVDGEGFVNPGDVQKAIIENTLLVSIMQANNEIGTIEPISEIGMICKENGVYFHTDACQSFTKTELDVTRQHLDLVSLNGHKIHGPKGVGVIYIKKGTNIQPLLYGGGQEANFRPGTYNTCGIVGFGKAVEVSEKVDQAAMIQLRDYFISALENSIDDVFVNGPRGTDRLANNISVHFSHIEGKKLFLALNKKDIFVSTGSACSSTKLTPSKVLMSIGQDPQTANGAIRMSTSVFTTKEELDYVVKVLTEIVGKARR